MCVRRLWLNGKEEPITERFKTCLRELRRMAGDRIVDGVTVVTKEGWADYHVRVVSVNTFPTAAGLASSAAGYACLVFSLAQLFCVSEEYEGELSTIARQGSGSACRSLYGGFVRWQKGEKPDASDSVSRAFEPLFPSSFVSLFGLTCRVRLCVYRWQCRLRVSTTGRSCVRWCWLRRLRRRKSAQQTVSHTQPESSCTA